jgi:LmeA-like phospholipid-binding
MSAVIRSVLSPLINIWLRSQVESIQTLEIEIAGRDGQILKGLIPSARVVATGVIYQGLHLSDLCLTASEINLNTPQVLRREPLKLLQPIQVNLELNLTPTAIVCCLESSLVKEAISTTFSKDFLDMSDDRHVLAILTQILTKLGDEFKLEELSIVNGNFHCKGIFRIEAT